MTQQEKNSEPSQKPIPKSGSMTKWIVVIVVVIVVIGIGVGVALTYHPPKQSGTVPLSVAPTVSPVSAAAGSNLTFNPGLPSGTTFTKLVWNFGDSHTETVTSGDGVVSYSYAFPGDYLVSVTAYNQTSSVSNNASLLLITVTPSTNANPDAIYGPILLSASSTGNQTISTGGWVNLTYAGLLGSPALTVGSQVPGATDYTIQSFKWYVDNGSSTIADNNTGLPETVNLTFSSSGFHSVELTTTSSSGSNEAVGSYFITIAVGDYSVSTSVSTVSVNTQQLVDAEYEPGGPSTFDPASTAENLNFEIIHEVYQTLIQYNGTSDTEYSPVVAKYVPTVANGGISADYLNYTFYINTSVQFSNGDHVTPYDVYVSMARSLLFANDPGTAGFVIAQSLIPGPTMFGPYNESFYWIHHAVTWNNATDTVTFHLLPNTPTWLPDTPAIYAGQNYGVLNQSYPVSNFGTSTYFLELLLAGSPTASIMDYSWLAQHGAAPSNTSASYNYYSSPTTSPGLENNWNSYVQYHAMGSGPYEISIYEPSQEVIFTVNPYYNATPGAIAKSSLIPKVIIEYLTSLTTAQQQIESGYAQLAYNAFPVASTPTALGLINKGVIKSSTPPAIFTGLFNFNLEINLPGAKTFDSKTNIPTNFFANLSVRQTFGYAFNYSYYINDAETSNGVSFATLISGVFPASDAGAPTNITAEYPMVQDMNLAKKAWEQTPYYKNGTKLYLPIINSQGNPAQDNMIALWIQDLSIATNGQVTMTPIDVPHSELVSDFAVAAGQNPMPLYFETISGDYPNPAEFAAFYLQEHGLQTEGNALESTPGFNPTTNPNQWENISAMWALLNQTVTTTNSTLKTLDYYKAEKILLSLFLYVGTTQMTTPYYYSSAIDGSTLGPTFNPAISAAYTIFYPIQYNK